MEKALLVAVTGFGQQEDRRRTRQAGFDGLLVKPWSLTPSLPCSPAADPAPEPPKTDGSSRSERERSKPDSGGKGMAKSSKREINRLRTEVIDGMFSYMKYGGAADENDVE